MLRLTKVIPALFFVFIFCLSACSKSTLNRQTKDSKEVLCTIGMISDLVRAIAQDKIEVSTLIKEDLDPHSYELVKGDDEKLARADLIFYNGLGLEHCPNIYLHLSEHRNSYSIGDYIRTENPDLILYIDSEVDPHIWMDVSIWEKGVELILKELINLMPEHEDAFRKNAASLRIQMMDVHNQIKSMLQKIPDHQRYLITCHDAFYYFARGYLSSDQERNSELWKRRFIAPEGLAPDSQLSTKDLEKVIQYLETYQVTTLFPEYNVNLDSLNKIKEISNKAGYPVQIASSPLYGDTMSKSKKSNQTYLDLILYNATVIQKHLMTGAQTRE